MSNLLCRLRLRQTLSQLRKCVTLLSPLILIFTLFVTVSSVLAQDKSAGEMEEVLVTGKKASLINSLNAKRDAQSVLDGMSAEELGLFPDANVADSLSHIPGVTIDRVRGEGKGVNIRGLGPEFSIVTMNGRLMASDQEGRDFAFDVLPAEVISGAWVHKSVTAKTLEGSIGGAIDLTTAKPFDVPGFKATASLEGGYSDKADDHSYKITGVLSNTFADETFGVLFSVLHSNTPLRTDEMTDLNYTENWSWDREGDGIEWQDADNELRLPNTFAYGSFLEDRERSAVSATLQFRPSDRFDIAVDVLFTRLDAPATAYTASWYTLGAANRWENVQYSGPTDIVSPNTDTNPGQMVLNPQGIFVTGYDIPDFVPEIVTEVEHRVVDTYQFGFNAAFSVSDTFELQADIYTSNATRDAGGKELFIASHNVGAVPNTTSFSLNPGGLPNVSIDFSDNPDVNSMADLMSDSDFGPHYSQSTGVDIEDEVFGASFDVSKSFDSTGFSLGFSKFRLASMDFGVNYSDRTKERIQYDNQHARELYSGAPFTFADTGISVVRPVALDGLLSEVSGDFLAVFVGFDPEAYQQALVASNSNPSIINPDTGEPYPEGYSNDDEPRFNGNASFSVAEETVSAYIQANIESDNWWANLGLRQSQTSTQSNGWSAPITQIIATDEGYFAEYGELVTISESKSYSNLLPSVNFGYQITEALLMRVSAAKVISRASMNQLSTQVNDEYLTWGEWLIESVGNPRLSPVEADQYDVALEWYYSEDSALTVGAFYKDIDGFIQGFQDVYPNTEENGFANPDRPQYPVQDRYDDWVPIDGSFTAIPFNLVQPQNLDSASALGFELGWQHFFDSGFGITANYTEIDTESVISESVVGVLPGVAERFYSASFIYETGPLSTQFYINHTESYIDSHYSPLNIYGSTNYKSTVEAYTDASFSASYAATESAVIFIAASNLLNANWHSYQGRSDIPSSYAEWGRKLTLGFRYNF